MHWIIQRWRGNGNSNNNNNDIIWHTTQTAKKVLQNIRFESSWRSLLFFHFLYFCMYIKDLKQIFWNGLFKQLWWNETCEVVVRYAPWCHFIVRYDSKYFKERKKYPNQCSYTVPYDYVQVSMSLSPSFLYSWSISHVYDHELYYIGRLGSQGQ